MKTPPQFFYFFTILSRVICAGFLLLISYPAFASQRFISLAPNLTEMVYAAGAGEQLVGVSSFSNYPAQALKLPQISNYVGIDIENVLALKPTTILALQDENPLSQLQVLQQLGVDIKIFKIEKFADVLNTINWIGNAAGTQSVAKIEVNRLNSQYKFLKRQNANQRKLKVLYLISVNPLLTLNKNNLVSQLINDCGGINIYDNLTGAAPQISWSSVLIAQPDVIFVAYDATKKNNMMQIIQKWPQLKAVQAHHVFYLNADWTNRPGPRSVQGMKQICADLALARK